MYDDRAVTMVEYWRWPSSFVYVSVAPKIEYPPLSERKEEGQSVQFQCKVEGTPYPVTTIKWRRENDPIDVSINS